MVTYYGPHFSSWGMRHGFKYSLDGFVNACMGDEDFQVSASEKWSDDPWYLDQEKREFYENSGFLSLYGGVADGRIIGGHIRSFLKLKDTEFMPSMKNNILLLEEDAEVQGMESLTRLLQEIASISGFEDVNGIIIGRFQKQSKITNEDIQIAISSAFGSLNIPILANVDVGHTTPISTFPIGGHVLLDADKQKIRVYAE